ncbi:MAG: T9SS type A sorting domain-containing protein, partial [Bacteroidota bacterium]
SNPSTGEFRVEITRLEVSSTRAPFDLGNTVYPNPTDGILNFHQLLPSRVEILDALGQRVFLQTRVTNQIDVSELTTGVYTLFVQLPDGRLASRKLVKR